jgi:hypothetical protein
MELEEDGALLILPDDASTSMQRAPTGVIEEEEVEEECVQANLTTWNISFDHVILPNTFRIIREEVPHLENEEVVVMKTSSLLLAEEKEGDGCKNARSWEVRAKSSSSWLSTCVEEDVGVVVLGIWSCFFRLTTTCE